MKRLITAAATVFFLWANATYAGSTGGRSGGIYLDENVNGVSIINTIIYDNHSPQFEFFQTNHVDILYSNLERSLLFDS